MVEDLPLEKERSSADSFFFNLKLTRPVKLIPFIVGEIEAKGKLELGKGAAQDQKAARGSTGTNAQDSWHTS